MGPSPVTGCPCKREDSVREDSHVKTEPEPRALLTQAKERLGLPEAGRDREGEVDSSYREVGSEGHLKQSVSEVMKAHLLRPGKKDASCRNRREGLEIWRLDTS